MDPGAVEERLRKRARDFEIPALLYTLEHHGFAPHDMVFVGHISLGPQPSLVHELRFYDGEGGRRRVDIVLNLGMVSCRSPLPAYFTELLHHVDTADALRSVVHFIDAKLLAERSRSYRPERHREEWPRARADLLSLVGVRSPNRVHAFFQHIFPELEVAVDRSVGSSRVRVGGTRLGHDVLGECAFGTFAQAPNQGLHVTLTTHTSLSLAGVPWRKEAARRMDQLVLPHMATSDMFLWVELIISGEKYLKLDRESSFGYDPMPGGKARPFRLTLFRDHLRPPLVNDGGSTRALGLP